MDHNSCNGNHNLKVAFSGDMDKRCKDCGTPLCLKYLVVDKGVVCSEPDGHAGECYNRYREKIINPGDLYPSLSGDDMGPWSGEGDPKENDD